MRRRDALSEKKRERLMQEHEQLQKLMLQARSSVRRSSLKNEADANPEQPKENNTEETEDVQEFEKPVLQRDNEIQEEPIVTKKEPLTEKDLFPKEVASQQNTIKKPLLTEKELFPSSQTEQPGQTQPKTTVVNVIRPDQNVQAAVAQRKIDPEENEIAYHSTIAEPIRDSDGHDIQEPNPITYNDDFIKEKKPHRRTALFITLVMLVLLAGFTGYYLYMSNQKNNTSIATPTPTPRKQPKRTESSPNTTTTGTVNNEPVSNGAKPSPVTTPADKKIAEQSPTNGDGLSNMLKKFDNVTIVETPVAAKKQLTTSNNNNSSSQTASDLGKYKVISKAYFHDAPEESTRRKAFIIHWNDAVLTPVEEKNGFVYVVFTNHLGQTTKGWLRMQDLQRIN